MYGIATSLMLSYDTSINGYHEWYDIAQPCFSVRIFTQKTK